MVDLLFREEVYLRKPIKTLIKDELVTIEEIEPTVDSYQETDEYDFMND